MKSELLVWLPYYDSYMMVMLGGSVLFFMEPLALILLTLVPIAIDHIGFKMNWVLCEILIQNLV